MSFEKFFNGQMKDVCEFFLFGIDFFFLKKKKINKIKFKGVYESTSSRSH